MELSDINTALPAVVVDYHAADCRATVKVTLPKKLTDGTGLDAPQIVNVPVCFPVADIRGALAKITVPVKAGDGVVLVFCQRSLENWLSGATTAPDDPRMFDLSDAFAFLGANQQAINADPSNVAISYGGGEVLIAPSGAITLNAPSVTVNAPTISFHGDLTLNGAMSATGDVSAGGKSLIGHRHKGDSGGTTGEPL